MLKMVVRWSLVILLMVLPAVGSTADEIDRPERVLFAWFEEVVSSWLPGWVTFEDPTTAAATASDANRATPACVEEPAPEPEDAEGSQAGNEQKAGDGCEPWG